MSDWTIYILRCSDNSLYTGITKNIAKRVEEHNTGGRSGAKYTRGRRPVRLVYKECATSRSDATRRENEIKRMQKGRKELLVSAYQTK
jgi:putative endonuclease